MCDYYKCFTCRSKISYDDIIITCPECESNLVRGILPTEAEQSQQINLDDSEKDLFYMMLG